VQRAIEWFTRQHLVPPAELHSVLYCYLDEEAVRHMMSVACGLDSLVLGEPEILGQMKNAFSEGCAAGSVGSLFHRLFQQIFSVAKEVRATTAIGACPVSIASTTVNLLKQNAQKSLHEASILLVGAGDTIELMLRHLLNHAPQSITLVNRDHEKAKILAGKYASNSGLMIELPKLLTEVDIVVSATSSTLPIITKNMLTKRTYPLLMVDLAVPRDIEEAVGELPHVRLFSIDDLKSIVKEHIHGRAHAAEKAREVIDKKSKDFTLWMRSLDKVAFTIRAYRKQIEELSDEQLTKAIRQLNQGENPAHVLTSFAHTLTNKLLHAPTVQLRQAVFEGRFELLELAQQLFSIPELDAELA
jgi:glutamyl-tRNA reductase